MTFCIKYRNKFIQKIKLMMSLILVLGIIAIILLLIDAIGEYLTILVLFFLALLFILIYDSLAYMLKSRHGEILPFFEDEYICFDVDNATKKICGIKYKQKKYSKTIKMVKFFKFMGFKKIVLKIEDDNYLRINSIHTPKKDFEKFNEFII